jgi:DNA-binding NarL/FixJ family response regulator
MISVLVVSPVPAVRAGLRALLAAVADIVVAGEAAHADEAAARPAMDDAAPAPGLRADVIVLDPPPAFDATDLAALGQDAPEAGIVILGPIAADLRLPAVLTQRGWAYLSRDADGEQLAAAVRAVAAGLVVIDPELGGQLGGQGTGAAGAPPGGAELTPREREVLHLVAVGLPNKLIARRLGVSEHTVKFHVGAILAKLGAASRTEAVHLAAQRGLIAL